MKTAWNFQILGYIKNELLCGGGGEQRHRLRGAANRALKWGPTFLVKV